jgi:hypothetical protein
MKQMQEIAFVNRGKIHQGKESPKKLGGFFSLGNPNPNNFLNKM